MYKRNEDGSLSFTKRFWVYTIIASAIIVWIGYRTQTTADKVEDTTRQTAQFAQDTNNCLADVVDVLTARVGYNEALDALDRRRQAVDAQRQSVWEQLVADLAAADNHDGLNLAALHKFEKANQAIKDEQAAITRDQNNLVSARNSNQYPECPQILKDKQEQK